MRPSRTHPRTRPGGALAAALAVLLAGALAGCAPSRPVEVHLVWPPSPARPRIRYVGQIRQAADLVKPNALQRFASLVTGKKGLAMLRPNGVSIEPGKRLYVTDEQRQALLVFNLHSSGSRMVDRAGSAYLVSPVGVAACGDDVALADSVLRKVFVLTPKGKLIRTIDKPGGFQRPTGLAYDAARGLLYVVDTLANEVCVFDLATGRLVRRFGSHGTEPGQFNYPTHICLDAKGTVYVTDSMNFRVQMFDPFGRFLGEIGTPGDATGHMAVPKGVAVDSFGHIYVVDSYFSTIQIFDRQGRFLLAFGEPGTQPGQFEVPTGLAIDAENRIYVCDSYNGRIDVFQYVGGTDNEQAALP